MSADSSVSLAAALRHAARYALLAPSVHGTRPWRIRLADRTLEIYLDRSRQLRALDPAARQLTISCGCAAFNARVGLAELGLRSHVERFPGPEAPDLAYRIQATGLRPHRPSLEELEELEELAQAVPAHHTPRGPLARSPLPEAVIDELVAMTERTGVHLLSVHHPEDRDALVAIVRRADEIENADAACRRELRRCTIDEPRRAGDGPAGAVPYAGVTRSDAVRRSSDLDAHGAGRLPAQPCSDLDQSLLLLGVDRNDRVGWLRTGEALERVLLTLTRRGYVASPVNQPVEVRATHDELRLRLYLTWHPQVLLRAGRAARTPATVRRPLDDVPIDFTGARAG